MTVNHSAGRQSLATFMIERPQKYCKITTRQRRAHHKPCVKVSPQACQCRFFRPTAVIMNGTNDSKTDSRPRDGSSPCSKITINPIDRPRQQQQRRWTSTLAHRWSLRVWHRQFGWHRRLHHVSQMAAPAIRRQRVRARDASSDTYMPSTVGTIQRIGRLKASDGPWAFGENGARYERRGSATTVPQSLDQC